MIPSINERIKAPKKDKKEDDEETAAFKEKQKKDAAELAKAKKEGVYIRVNLKFGQN